MAIQIIWSDAALDDLYAVRVGLADDTAARVGRLIVEATDCLVDFPDRGREGRAAGTRELPLPGLPWRLIYRWTKDTVTVLRLLAAP